MERKVQPDDKVMWLVGSEEGRPYQTTTWYRCAGIQDFVDKVEKKFKIIGVIASENNLGFIIEEK